MDDILAGEFDPELGHKGGSDAATENIDGVLGAVDKVVDALVHTVEVLAGRKEAVEVEDLVAVVAQVFEEHTLGVAQVEEVERLG